MFYLFMLYFPLKPQVHLMVGHGHKISMKSQRIPVSINKKTSQPHNSDQMYAAHYKHLFQDILPITNHNIIIIVVMSTRCNICKKTAVQPLNLRCDHHPCYQCAQSLVSFDSNSKIQLKYQLTCPTCTKRTVFYDLRHLILTAQQNNQEEQLFVTDKFLSTRAQPKISGGGSITPRGQTGESSQHMTRRGSIQSIANSNKMLLQVRCAEHNQVYKYFCADCCEKGNRRCLVCAECAKPHHAGGHRLLALKQAESRLLSYNMKNKEEMLVKTGEITFMMQALTNNRAALIDHFRKLQQGLTFQFEQVMDALRQNYQRTKSTLDNHLSSNLREIDERMEKLGSHQNILDSLKQIQLKDLQTSMKFYQTYEKYTITNQLSQIKVDFDASRWPTLAPKVDQLASIALDWMDIAFPEAWQGSKTKNRKNSTLEQPMSQRSAREKENKRIALCQTNLNFKKSIA